MLMEWKASAKTGEGISILQSTTDKFMVVLYPSLYLTEPIPNQYWIPTIPDTYPIPDILPDIQPDRISSWISGYPAGYPVDLDIRYSPIDIKKLRNVTKLLNFMKFASHSIINILTVNSQILIRL